MLLFPPGLPQDAKTSNNPSRGRATLGPSDSLGIRPMNRPLKVPDIKASGPVPYFGGAHSGDVLQIPLDTIKETL